MTSMNNDDDGVRRPGSDDSSRGAVEIGTRSTLHGGVWLHRRALLIFLLLVPSLLIYLPYLQKGFVSEDFLLIPLHREQPPWHDLVATFTRPWLEMKVFQFYRPFATLAFGAESALFGGHSTGYNAVHLATHLLSTLVLWQLMRLLLGRGGIGAGERDDDRDQAARRSSAAAEIAAFVSALYFSLYPLAPNSVMFAGSFANVFGALATLTAAFLYVRRVEESRERREVASVAGWVAAVPGGAVIAYVVALGCYESSAALPLWLVLYEGTNLILRDSGAGAVWRRSWRRILIALAPFGLISVGYVALRGALFGEALGGYSNVADRLRGFDAALLAQALRAVGRVPSPWYGQGAGASTEMAVAGAVWILAGLWVVLAPAVMRRTLVRVFLLGSGWTLAFLAPFSFPLVPPAAGRYLYLASAGVGLALAAAMMRAAGVANERAASARRRISMAVVSIVVAALFVRNVAELRSHLRWMNEAANVASAIADAVAREELAGRAAGHAVGEPIFVTDYPLFVRGPNGVELAQIYHYGLRAALGPPFRKDAINVYPLPPRTDADPGRLAADHRVFAWDAPRRVLTRVEPTTSGLPPAWDGGGPAGGAIVSLDDAKALRLRGSHPGGETRIVVSAPGNFMVARLAPGQQSEPALPAPFMALWGNLAPGPQLWWLEARDTSGRLVAQSTPRWLIPAAGVSR